MKAAVDYSRFEQLAKEEEEAEKRAKELERAKNRDRYMKDQDERKKKWVEDKKAEKAAAKAKANANAAPAPAASAEAKHSHGPDGHGHSHGGGSGSGSDDGHGHAHGHAHDGHDHDGHSHAPASASTVAAVPSGAPATATAAAAEEDDEQMWASHSSCGCGYVDPERLKKLAEERASKPEMPLEVRNKKKMVAVEATRLDGNRLFKEGLFQEAFQVYERGVLIANGTHGLSEADQEVLNKLEITLDLNIAACRLKLKQYLEAVEACKIVLNLDANNVKARYRKGEAYVGMGEFNTAIEHFQDCLKVATGAEAAACNKMIAQCRTAEQQQTLKQRAFDKEMAEKLRNASLNTPATTTAAAPASASAAVNQS